MSRYSQEVYQRNLANPALASDCIHQQRMDYIRRLYGNDIAPCTSAPSVMNKSEIDISAGDWFANQMRCLNEDPRDGSREASWGIESASVFQSAPSSIVTSRKSDRWPDAFSVCSSSSFSKSISGESADFRKYSCLYGESPEQKSHYNHRESDQNFVHTPRSTFHRRPNVNKSNICQMEHAIFELIKAQCISNPLLMKKVVEWGVEHSKSNRITCDEITKLSHGRLWISVRSTSLNEDEYGRSSQNMLEEIKGAYQEAEQGVYKQPTGRRNGAEIQHRLMKDSVGRWVIEKYDWESREWCSAARELQDGLWVDCRNNKAIQLRVIPMRRILERLRKSGTVFERLEKSVDFLFNACDQMKLNGKLKTRNLKHNIANLKAKLEKQHALSFAISVVDTAQSITDDVETSHSFRKCY